VDMDDDDRSCASLEAPTRCGEAALVCCKMSVCVINTLPSNAVAGTGAKECPPTIVAPTNPDVLNDVTAVVGEPAGTI
jgi:hypothetical protein